MNIKALFNQQQAYVISFLIICFLSNSLCFAQNKVRKLGTHAYEKASMSKNLQIQQNKKQIEQYIATNKNRLSLQPHPVIIPLVFHIVYNEKVEQISEAQIWSQITKLNQNFSHQHITVQQLAEEAEGLAQLRPDQIPIQFCLAKRKDAIHYLPSNTKEWGLNNAIKSDATGGCNPLDPTKYLNIWVTNLADSVSGFSTMPWSEKSFDGILIDYEFFGTMGTAKAPFSGGATLTHLIGNFLGLRSLWSEKCEDDGIFDTPIHNSPNRGCPGYKHISLCDGHKPEMVMNYMDNTYDECMYMFTYGQMQRMYLMLSEGGPRHELVKQSLPTICEAPNGLQEADVRSKLNNKFNKNVQIDLQIIPNPADNKVNIQVNAANDSPLSLVIYNALGNIKTVRDLVNQEHLELNTKNWESGTYFIHCKNKWTAKTYQLMIAH